MKKTFLLLSLLLCAALCGCGRQPAPVAAPSGGPELAQEPDYAPGKELFTLADSEEEAREIAETYGIELVEYEMGVAAYHTQEDPFEVVRRGREQGWPALEVNHVVRLDENEANNFNMEGKR